MEYYFKWKTFDNHGACDGVFEQIIYGKTLARALSYFEGFHGKVGTMPDGTVLEITTIKESN